MNTVLVYGTLRVTYLNGRFGQFPVGSLETVIGTFTVRGDDWLEMLDAGEYEGEFCIAELSLYSYRAYGEQRTAIRAVIERYTLAGYETDIDEPVELIPDPVEEDMMPIAEDFQRTPPPKAVVPETEQSTQSNEIDAQADNQEDIALLRSFMDSDSQWQKGDDYRVDTTIGRANILKCRQILLSMGYQFDPINQMYRLEASHG